MDLYHTAGSTAQPFISVCWPNLVPGQRHADVPRHAAHHLSLVEAQDLGIHHGL